MVMYNKIRTKISLKEVIKMTRTICYEEVCGINDKIHLWSILLTSVIAATVIYGALLINTAWVGLELSNISLFPTEF